MSSRARRHALDLARCAHGVSCPSIVVVVDDDAVVAILNLPKVSSGCVLVGRIGWGLFVAQPFANIHKFIYLYTHNAHFFRVCFCSSSRTGMYDCLALAIVHCN